MVDLKKKRFPRPHWEYYALLAAFIWTLSLAASFAWNVHQGKRGTLEAAQVQARSLFRKDVMYRRWNAGHGGVYVPVTPAVQPNPYLSGVPDREIRTPSGRLLTLINPAYMTRQVHALERGGYGIRSHITSLTPIRPQNAPDSWEISALKAFSHGSKEVSSVEQLDGKAHLRFMQPLIAEEPCLKCHAKQGYRDGDVYGGISVSISLEPFLAIERDHLLPLVVGHVFVYLFGIAGLGIGVVRIRSSENERIRVEDALRRALELSGIVLDATHDAICIIDAADFKIVGANHVFLKEVGMNEEDVLGKTCHGATHNSCEPCAPPDHTCPLQATISTGTGSVAEHIHYSKQGEKLYVEVSTYPIFDGLGKINRVLHVARDISERKRAEESLRESENRYRAIFENTGAATIIVDEDATIFMANKEFEQLSGYFKEEVDGVKCWTDFVCRDDLDKMLEYHRLRRLDPDAAPRNYEFRFLAAGNTVKDVSANWTMIPGTNKSVGSFLDITGHKRIEEALRESEASLATAQKIAHLGSWEWDVEADAFKWSDEMYRICGMDPRVFMVTYEAFLDMVHPLDKEAVNRAVNESLYAQKAYRIDYRIVLPDGSVRMVDGQGEVTFDEAGKPIRMVGTTQDVTWRKEAEEALRKSEEKFSKAFHASPDWIVITNAADGKYIEVNEAFLEITGYGRDEVIGRTSIEMGIWFDPRDRILMLKLLNEHGLVRNLEVSFCIKSGELRTMLWSADVIEYNNTACLIAIARDVTEQRHLEKELLKSQAQLYMKHEELKNLFNQMETIRREWEQTLDCIADMFILTDHEGRIKRFNRAVEDFTGKTHRDIVGREWGAFLAEHGLQANADKPGVEIYNGSADKWLVFNLYPYSDPFGTGNTGVVITIHDASATRMAAKAMGDARGDAEGNPSAV